MILDHIEYYEEVHFPTNKRTIQARYCIEREAVTSEREMGLVYDEIRVELAKQIQKEMIRDLSEYFVDSFDDKDIEYVATLSHRQLEKMRKLAELTKWMTIDEVEKALRTYEVLTDLAACGRKGLNHETDR